MRRQLAGARAIVTGASSGIGRALALELARRGARLVLGARRADRLADVAHAIGEAGSFAVIVPGDITSPEVRDQLVLTARNDLGGLDLLINNAGIGGLGPFADAPPERLRRIMEVNFFAPVELIRTALPLLRSGHRPLIVNIASVLAHRAVPDKSEYCASKFALHGFSDALRSELTACGIDVLVVNPSTTDTEFFDELASPPHSQARRAMPAERVAWHTVRAIEQGRHEILLSCGGKALVWLDRLFPTLANQAS